MELEASVGIYRAEPVNGSALRTSLNSPSAADEPGTYRDPPAVHTRLAVNLRCNYDHVYRRLSIRLFPLGFEPNDLDVDCCMCMGHDHSLPGIEGQGQG